MHQTAYHARYFAHELVRQNHNRGGVEPLAMSLFDACVDLNPHQIDAALFALRSPVSKGVLLADEVGLGKTIEAGLVICQYWAERRRRLLVIVPASIRKQWSLELEEKFSLPTVVLDSKAYRAAQEAGNPNPFDQEAIVICSVHFASRMQGEVRAVPWDLVVIDEAHKLRNAHQPSNKLGQSIRWALEDRRKLLLTATPLQNSLMELFGLSTLIDEMIFGDAQAFRTQYGTSEADLADLRRRLKPFCQRTLRKHVVEYIPFTERRAITCPFDPTDEEQRLYEAVSAFTLREDTFSIPSPQRHLMVLIVRKLLASSPQAIAATLSTMRERLQRALEGAELTAQLAPEIIEREEWGDELLEEGFEEEIDLSEESGAQPPLDPEQLRREIAELDHLIQSARGIECDSKARALLEALQLGFAEMERMGAARKALIFTESRRTQEYLAQFLEANGYRGEVVQFSGTNTSEQARAIYDAWLQANADTGRATGSRAIDVRTALVEYFRDHASIMIATEAGGEGINLQFCSLVINYDLPWNPQRIEQRIGRCHRYGQTHDVVVVNFLNQRNEADKRVLELLQEKFSLFSGLFGASDEILGSIESGVDFERRILAIYEQCRTPEEIAAAFQTLQAELEATISRRMQETRQMLLEFFDEDVHARLRMQLADARRQLDQFAHMFWALSRYVLTDLAEFDDDSLTFHLHRSPVEGVRPGHYHLISKDRENVPGEFLYRLSHPLGEHVIAEGQALDTPMARVVFDITNHPTRIAMVEQLSGKRGYLTLQRLCIQSLGDEEHLLFSALDERGEPLDQEACERLFRCDGRVASADPMPPALRDTLRLNAEQHVRATLNRSMESNDRFFQEERDRLDRWAEDMVAAAEKELLDTKAQIRALRRQSRQAQTTQEQLDLQSRVRDLERRQRRQRQRIFDVEDEISARRDELIEGLERRLEQRSSVETLFTIAWEVV